VQRAFQNPQLLCDLVQVETELLIRVAERVLERNQKKPSQSVGNYFGAAGKREGELELRNG
jgi:hypothetical protein